MVNQKATRHTIGSVGFTNFDYQEYGIMGVGKNRMPIINMDQYRDCSHDRDLHIECCKGLALAETLTTGMLIGALPPHEVEKYQGRTSWSEMLTSDWFDKNDRDGKHRQAIEEIAATGGTNAYAQINRYCYYALGSVIPWFFTLYLKNNDFNNKTRDITSWTKDSALFPQLVEYVKTLPFKEIGRVLFFATYPLSGVVTHRDSPVVEHSDHNINMFFDSGRPSYVWDDKLHEKTYLDPNAKSYFFNNRDYHGVDPEPVFRYTLRVDGTFTDELCEQLGLVEGKTWSWDYIKP